MKSTKEKIAVMQAYDDGREIEYCTNDGCGFYGSWHNYRGSDEPIWDWHSCNYRIKQSTILVNGIEVPEPVRVMPEDGTWYCFPSFMMRRGVGRAKVHACLHAESANILEAGMMHLTESAARQHYEALIAPSRVKK